MTKFKPQKAITKVATIKSLMPILLISIIPDLDIQIA